MVSPGEPGRDCERCGGSTRQVGYDGGVYGIVCEDCDMLTVLPGTEVYGGNVVELDT